MRIIDEFLPDIDYQLDCWLAPLAKKINEHEGGKIRERHLKQSPITNYGRNY